MSTPKPKLPRGTKALLASYQRAKKHGAKYYEQARQLLDELVTRGTPIGQPITLNDKAKSVVVLTDKLAGKNRVFTPTFFTRYAVEDFKAPKKAKDAPAVPEEPAE